MLACISGNNSKTRMICNKQKQPSTSHIQPICFKSKAIFVCSSRKQFPQVCAVIISASTKVNPDKIHTRKLLLFLCFSVLSLDARAGGSVKYFKVKIFTGGF